MNKFISKEMVIKTIDNVVSDMCAEGVPDIVAAVVECIKVDIGIIPTVDIPPAKRGDWVIFYLDGKLKLKCTNCHSVFDTSTNDKHMCIFPKFCAECGADMRNTTLNFD